MCECTVLESERVDSKKGTRNEKGHLYGITIKGKFPGVDEPQFFDLWIDDVHEGRSDGEVGGVPDKHLGGFRGWIRDLAHAAGVTWNNDFMAAINGAAIATSALGPAIAVGVRALTRGMGRALSPGGIRFSQTSVNDVGEISADMAARGWKGQPIDVVQARNGIMTTLDNTRLLAASRAGISVRATVHQAQDLLPPWMVERFATPKGVPTTWGDALRLRIRNQSASYRSTYPNGSPTIGSAE
jgi:hypothetical protein